MTGKQIVDRAAMLLGGTGEAYPWGERLGRLAYPFVTMTAEDVWDSLADTPFPMPATLSEPLPLPDMAASTLACGVARLFAKAGGDAELAVLLDERYQRHFAALQRPADGIRDRLWEVSGCED